MKYRITYTGKDKHQSKDFNCGSPVTALNQFHHFMQIVMERSPKDYKIERLALIHSANAYSTTPQVESAFDLPQSSNPDVGPLKQHTNGPKTEGMAFIDETVGQGKLAE